jgi:hypothetical protein
LFTNGSIFLEQKKHQSIQKAQNRAFQSQREKSRSKERQFH